MAGESVAGRTGIVGVLNREWVELVRDHQGTIARWSARHAALAGCGSLDDLLSAARTDSDPVLSALLAEVATGDRLAGRVVLHLMIGRMVAMATRDPRGTVDDYLSALCCRIYSYDLEARPRAIAANLSLDALQLVSRERRWTRRREVVPWPPEAFADDHRVAVDDVGTGLRAAEVLAAACRLRLISPSVAELLDDVYVQNRSRRIVAGRHLLSANALRVRCHRAVSTLAEHANELLEAC